MSLSKDNFLLRYGTAEHLDKILPERPGGWWKVKNNPNLQPRHLQMVWDAPDSKFNTEPESIMRDIASHDFTNGELHEKAFNHESYLVRNSAMHNVNVTPEQILKRLDDPHPIVRSDAAMLAHDNGFLTPEHARRMFSTDSDRENVLQAKSYLDIFAKKAKRAAKK